MRTMTKAERFFWLNAGFSYNPKTQTKAQGRRECAEALAQAEAYARNLGFEFEWEHDSEPWDAGDTDYVPTEVLNCRIPDPENSRYSLASLCGIADPDANYRRVIEAELASEALAQYDREVELLDAH